MNGAVASGPYSVVENCWIGMRDGVQLAARLWLPGTAATTPVAAIFEYYPYRKRDFIRGMDDVVGAQLASHGFAYVRVDVRGTGDSAGVIRSEYDECELQDGIEIIAWIAAQPWCTGAVGMRGISWAGFNSLLIAARAPPNLKAIVVHGATDNQFTDDAHYAGGCLLLINYMWGLLYYTRLMAPPDPEVVGDQWRVLWQQRLRAAGPILAEWLSHQRFDRYWQHGSVCGDYSKIKCPVYVVGGLLDGYRNGVPRLLERLQVPCKGLIGPWSHTIPELAIPGPALAFLDEEAAWFDHWLNKADNGVMDTPQFRTYVTDRFAAEAFPANTPGRWIAERRYPSANISTRELHLSSSRLAPGGGPERWCDVTDDDVVGLQTRYWFPYPAYMQLELPGEQTLEDARSTCFETEPLPEALEIVGTPVLKARVRADRPVAVLAVRLTEVTSDGQSQLASFGILNLTHRDSDETPAPLQPGVEYDIAITLYYVAHRFRAGSKLRVGLSTGLWPMAWPAPERCRLQILEGRSRLLLPVRQVNVEEPPALPAVLDSPRVPPTFEELQPIETTFQTHRDDTTGRVDITETYKYARRRVIATNIILSGNESWSLSISPDDPASSCWSGSAVLRIERGAWRVQMCANMRLTCNAANFYLEETLSALDRDDVVYSSTVNSVIPRDLM